MELRKAIPADAAGCAKILGDWFASTDFVPRIHTPEEDLAFMQYVIDTQDVRVADGDGIVAFSAKDGNELNLLYVDGRHRGLGIGGKLLDATMQNETMLWLWCFQANSGARKLYERKGFQVTEFTDGADNEEKTPDVRYEWRKS